MNKKDPVLVSYFTKNTLYEKEAERLRLSCEKFGLEYRIEGIEVFGKWHEHTCYKPLFILQKMEELKRPVLWVDADAEIVKKPPLHFNCDVGARIFDYHPPDHPCYLFTGTLYLNVTPVTLDIVKKWAEICHQAIRNRTYCFDQIVLNQILHSSKAHFQSLSAGYAAIFDEKRCSTEELFIVHYQASRLYRKIIDGELSFPFFEHLSVEELRQLRPRTEFN